MSVADKSDDASVVTIETIENSNDTVVPSVTNENIENSATTNDEEKPITTVSHNRRVHFPTDDSQLQVYSYEIKPLSNQPLTSLGVILQRYRATCQRLNVRPIAALLDQLNMMDDGRKSFYDRLDCLKIVNEKLDVKHVEAIEEIFSRCRFHTIDLESTYLDESTSAQLFDIVEYYESCTHLNLSNNRSINSFPGYQILSKYLRRTHCLERLDMNSIKFDETTIINMTRSIRLSATLYELHVESCQLNGRVLQKFIHNIRSCTTLRELYLGDNRLQTQDSLLINELIRTCGQFLYILDLRSNLLQDVGISHIASQFSQYDEFHINENRLLKISFEDNQLTQQGVGILAKSLLHNRTLRSINLSNNNIMNEGLILLRDALLTNRTINELILRNCHLTDQSAIALAEFIAESTTIHYIDLRENNFQASGICGIAIAIKTNRSLLRLDFDPIVVTPVYFNSSTAKNNNDRANSYNLLSISNLRRMTTGFSSFASRTTNSNFNVGGGGTRELLEQKARWMSDIAAVCQRNILIYEENARKEDETRQQNGNEQTTSSPSQNLPIINPEDIECNIVVADKTEMSTINDEIPLITDENVEQTEEISSVPIDNDQILDPSVQYDENDRETTTINDDAPVEINSIEIVSHDDQIPLIVDCSGASSVEEIDFDDRRKISHSDSIYLLREKAKSEIDHSETNENLQNFSSIN